MQTTLDNVIKVNETEFLTEMDGKKLLSMWKNKEIAYSPEIQRGMTIRQSKNDKSEKVPVFSVSNVKKIYSAMASGAYFTDMISLNVMYDMDNSFNYDSGTLTVIADCFDVSDGQHRLRALELLEKSNEEGKTSVDLESLKFAVKISHLSIEKAQQQFYQFSQGLKISSSRAEYFNHTDLPNLLVKRLIDKDMALEGIVEIVKNSIPKKRTSRIVCYASECH